MAFNKKTFKSQEPRQPFSRTCVVSYIEFFMLVVLRVKNVPPDSSGGFFLPFRLHFSNSYDLRLTLFISALFFVGQISGQTLGGSSIFNFLKLPATPQLTGLGGVNVSKPSNDVGMAFHNPALLNKEMHTRANLVFNDFYAGIKTFHLALGYFSQPLNTRFAGGVHYFDYGTIPQTDASGNVSGSFRPVDWVVQFSAARSYLEKWDYGATIKFIHSGYGLYRSTGMALDMGILFRDSSALFTASILAKNMGFQLKKYQGTDPDDLPFDLQIGMTKRLADAPFSFSITAQRAHQWDIRYDDTLFNAGNGVETTGKKFTFDKLFRHFVFAATVHPSEQLEFSLGYNHLRRQELNVYNASNGLNGFSLGVGVLLKKIQIRYARAYYQNNTALNQFGLGLKLNDYFGLGKWGERAGW